MNFITYNEVKYFPIPNFDKYFISRYGKILSCKRKNPNILKSWLDGDGYKRHGLSNNNKITYKHLHRLLAMTFLPNFSPELQVDHIDGNRINNNLSNLRMVTPSGNRRNMKYYSGVHLIHDKRNNSFHYRCVWCDELGVQHLKSFSCQLYGFGFALMMAHAVREEMVKLYYNRPS